MVSAIKLSPQDALSGRCPDGIAEVLAEPKIAVIAEGGGQRGIFTAGVLDSFMHAGFSPFRWMIGVSAGAQNMAAYALNEEGYGRKVIMELSTNSRFFKPLNALRKQPVIDLDWYFGQALINERYQLPVERLSAALHDRHLLIGVCEQNDWLTRYVEPEPGNLLRLLKASSAIPYLYRDGVELEHMIYVDGGTLAPLPLQAAIDLGIKAAVVIRTNTEAEAAGYTHKRPRLDRLARWHHRGANQLQQMAALYIQHENAVVHDQHLLDNPPDDFKLIAITPGNRLQSRLLGSRKQDLDADYQSGWLVGEHFLKLAHQPA